MNVNARRSVAAGVALSAALAVAAPMAGTRDTIAKARQELGARIDANSARIDALEGKAPPTTVVPTTRPTPTTQPTPTTVIPSPPTPPTTVPGKLCAVDPANNAEAINAAITACANGSTVQFPAGRTYTHASTIWIKNRANLTVDLNGSTFRSSAPNDNNVTVPSFYVMRSKGVTLRNGTIIGNFADRGEPNANRGAVTSNAGVGVAGGSNIKLADLVIRDVFGDGVFTANAYYHDPTDQSSEFVDGLRMERLDISNAARHCVSPNQGNDIWLVNSRLDRCFYDGYDAEKDLGDDPLTNLHIIGNTFSNWALVALVVPVGGTAEKPVRGVEIRDNKFLTLPVMAVCYQTIILGLYEGQRFADVVVEGNDIVTWRTGVLISRTTGVVVANNTIRVEPTSKPTDCGEYATNPVHVIDSTGVTVRDNRPS